MSFLDRIIGGCAVVALSPLSVVLAVLARLDDGGPLFFAQTRLRQGRTPFVILKFRTMSDGRVTRLGRRLRPAGIDELAQFINVARGEMVLIGPRPVTADDAERWNWRADDPRWNSPPGMAGLPGILGTRSARDATRLDRFYALKRGWRLDLTLISITVLMLFFTKSRVRIGWRKLRRELACRRRAGSCRVRSDGHTISPRMTSQAAR